MVQKTLRPQAYLSIPFLFIILVITLSGCSTISHQEKSLPSPETGKAIIIGRVLDLNGNSLKGTTIRLAEVYRESQASENGAFVLDTAFSPGAVTDENGFFTVLNISPGEYVLVVGDVENNNYTIVAQENGQPRVWRVSADQILDMGTLKVRYTSRQ